MRPPAIMMRTGGTESPRYRALSRGSRSRVPRVPGRSWGCQRRFRPASLARRPGPGWPVFGAVCRMRCPLRAVDGGNDDDLAK